MPCVDPQGPRLAALAMVKELHYLGLIAAGVHVVGIIASSNASASSFGRLVRGGKHFVESIGTDTYAGIPIWKTPHPKFASPGCINSTGVALSLDVPLDDRLAMTSAIVTGWAQIGVTLIAKAGGQQRETATREYSHSMVTHAPCMYHACTVHAPRMHHR